MNKFFLFISCIALFLVLFTTSVASALQVTPLNHQADLAPCQQAVFSFKVTSQTAAGQVAFHLTNTQKALNYSVPTSVYLNGNGGFGESSESTVDVAVLYPCDANPVSGVYPFTLVAQQGGEAVGGTSYISLAPSSSLAVSLTSEELACSCASSRLILELRNTGYNRQSGTALVSSQFPFSIADTSFDLQPGESTSKQIVVDLNCSVPAGVYPVSVGIVAKGSDVKYAYSGLNVARCYASNLTGPRQAAACYADPVNLQYSLFNNGNFQQDYVVSTTLGSLPFSQTTLPAHSVLPFNLSISPQFLPYPGTFNFSISAQAGQSFESIPVTLTTSICDGKPVPTLSVAYPVLDVNNTVSMLAGQNSFSITVNNPNSFSVHNAVLSLSGFGPISGLFNLNPNETASVPVVITLPANFTNAINATNATNTTTAITAILTLDSDQGRVARVLKLEPANSNGSNRATGLFVMGNYFISDSYLALGALAIVILAGLFYYAERQRRGQLFVDKEVSIHLEKILGKYRR